MEKEQLGKFIATLRKEHNLTQKALAQTIGVEASTISKWERGIGLPDATLLEPLATVFGVDMDTFLRGDRTKNPLHVGKLDRLFFYRCPHCNHWTTTTAAVSISCCGQKLAPLVAQEKGPTLHIEAIDVSYRVYVDHPMTKASYIESAFFVAKDRLHWAQLYPEQEAAFDLPASMRRANLYLYSTTEGFFVYHDPLKAWRKNFSNR